MSKLDKDEQAIYNAFSQIEVNTDILKRNVLMNQKGVAKKRVKLSVIMAAVLVFMALTATIYAATGGLDHFLSRFNPGFGEFAIAPLEPAYTEDQGIRLEVIGAQQIDHVVLVYVSIQDLSGDNRLTQYADPDIVIYVDGQAMNGPHSSRRLNFESSTNTAYFEQLIVGEVGMPRSDTLELKARNIYNAGNYSGQLQILVEGYWDVQVNTSDLGIQPLIFTDVTIGDTYIDYMSLSPFGLQITGRHQWDMNDGRRPRLKAAIELENRWPNIKMSSMAGGLSSEEFSFFSFADEPIDINKVTAVIINGHRITKLK